MGAATIPPCQGPQDTHLISMTCLLLSLPNLVPYLSIQYFPGSSPTRSLPSPQAGFCLLSLCRPMHIQQLQHLSNYCLICQYTCLHILDSKPFKSSLWSIPVEFPMPCMTFGIHQELHRGFLIEQLNLSSSLYQQKKSKLN